MRRLFSLALAWSLSLVCAFAQADEIAAKQVDDEKAKQEPAKPDEQPKAKDEKPNGELRADEGPQTALPSVAGRPIRRYAEKGVVELGGAVSLVKANSFTQIGITPTFGWFFIDYVELSFMPTFEWVKTFEAGGKGRLTFLVEPSFHISVGGPVFVFFGAGVGVVYEGPTGAGLAIAPRTGINVLIGGSGVLNVGMSYEYTATKRTAIEDGSTDPHTATFGFQSGYSVAW